MESLELARRLRTLFEDKKGADIVILDVRKRTNIADYFLIVTGTSAPHLKALSEDAAVTLKREGVTCFRRGGDPTGGWIVMDYVDVVAHIFDRERRAYYNIEELWAKAKRVE